MSSRTPSPSLSETLACVSNLQPDENGWVPWYACDANYLYYPSFITAVVFAIGFTFVLGAHTYQAFTYKKIRLSWVAIMCAAWEVAGLASRAVSTKHQQSKFLLYISNIFILLAPIWLNAFVYMTLGRMIYVFVPEQKLLGFRAQRIAMWFVFGDILSFVVQAAGGPLAQNDTSISLQMLGFHIFMAGIALQQLFILIFTAFALHFRSRMLSQERSIGQGHLPGGDGVAKPVKNLSGWRVLLFTLLLTLALISVRISYRLAEFASGLTPNNYLAFHEWCFYILDISIMFVALVVTSVMHPGRVLVVPNSEFPSNSFRSIDLSVKPAVKSSFTG